MASGNSPSTFHTALLYATHRLLLTFTVNPGPPAAGMMHESWHTHTRVTAWLWVHSNEGTHRRPKTCSRRVPHSLAPMPGSGMWVWGVFCDGILQLNTLAESLPFQPWPGSTAGTHGSLDGCLRGGGLLLWSHTSETERQKRGHRPGSNGSWGRGAEQAYELTSLWLPPRGKDLGKPHPAVLPSLGKLHGRAQGHTPSSHRCPQTAAGAKAKAHTYTHLPLMSPSRLTGVCRDRGGAHRRDGQTPMPARGKGRPRGHAQACTYTMCVHTGRINKDTLRSYTPRGTDTRGLPDHW